MWLGMLIAIQLLGPGLYLLVSCPAVQVWVAGCWLMHFQMTRDYVWLTCHMSTAAMLAIRHSMHMHKMHTKDDQVGYG